jgi:hypothetical protein
MTAWLAVVSADHVRRCVRLGIAQIGHGKRAGLTRMGAGDLLVYYSPRDTLAAAPLQEFTAIGRIADDQVWQADEGDFRPWRRRVDYDTSASAVALGTVRDRLDLTAVPRWGHQLRRGLVELTDHDADLLATAMGTDR